MGNLVEGRTEDFPVGKRTGGINYILIDECGEWHHYKARKGEKQDLMRKLDGAERSDCDLLGVWQGRHRSDVFVLDTEVFLDMLKDTEL